MLLQIHTSLLLYLLGIRVARPRSHTIFLQPNFFKINAYRLPASVHSKALTRTLTPLETTLTKNIGRDKIPVEPTAPPGRGKPVAGHSQIGAIYFALILRGVQWFPENF